MARKSLKEERLGEVNISNEGYKMKIIEYNGRDDIWIEFQDEHKARVHKTYQNFKKGEVKNPYHPSIYGVGYLGVGKHKTNENGKQTRKYKEWYCRFNICYNEYELNRNPTYKNVNVCEEWYNFQNFGDWYDEWLSLYPNDLNEKLCIDKDILVKGNKLYSPKTCMLVPERINMLFLKCDANRGKYPIGVCWHKNTNKFMASCSILDENGKKKFKNLGYYNTPNEAFLAYKEFKEKYIKLVADEYYLQDKIPKIVYDAMYNWIVEIDD